MRPAITFIFRTLAATLLAQSISGILCPLPAEAASDRLVIYSGRKEKAIKPVADAFTKQTGITVGLKTGKTSGLANEIRMEKAHPRGDLFIS
ncbi:MAG: substrate-binding domain-containing protein, partial [Nitrospirota bacterium]